MSRAAIVAAMWAPMVIAACCRPQRVPVPVVPRPCVTSPAPVPPPDAAPGSPRWIEYYADLRRWVLAVEIACEVPAAPETAGHYGG